MLRNFLCDYTFIFSIFFFKTKSKKSLLEINFKSKSERH